MRIGPIQLANPTIFAPLAGISDLPMRLLAKAAGCALVYSEMVSANGLVHGGAKTWQLLTTVPAEQPMSVQLFGGDPAMVAEAARRVAAAGAEIVDINCGCAVKKILKSGSGVALMRDLPRATAMLKAVRKAINVPLTIKMRTGWDPSGTDALALARIAQDCGVDALALHPRTARQGFGGRADWTLIERVKAAVDIPVIGNGDVQTADDAVRMLSRTGCDAVMVGRAAIGHPFIFNQIIERLAGREIGPVPVAARFDAIRRYVDAAMTYSGEPRACLVLRSRLAWFVKGMPRASWFRQAIRHIASRDEVQRHIDDYEALVAAQQA
ncbi:tRNA dihydrouridine synthase DusB [Desulfatitalea alkaliphila]|uniref:tRNA-dihydrouridine synthase n=1 Tax=Desulfatitalea alkaliphila TaxID=2929485 RepID=A0AA41UK11_9BACT|nr:tRNA dihydrouridine synthase DusB [Desulfatitalea alkaliphila]MCJ8499891.1 tRNA dihydrouridine synthase DusB [Desulfatitalea alkaliphila]